MIENLKLYIITSDKTYEILNISLIYWKKYWKYDIIVLGFNYGKYICEQHNVKFCSLGKNQNISNFSNYIYNYVKENEINKTLILSLDDMFPLKEIDYDRLVDINNKIIYDSRFVKASLSPSNYISKKDIVIDNEICSNSCSYFNNLQISLWETKYMLSIFSKKLSPWQLELSPHPKDKYLIKTTNIKDNIFETNLIKNFVCNSIIRSNTSSHLSSPYNWISLLGLTVEEINTVIKICKINENIVTFGHKKKGWFMCNFNDINCNADIRKYWSDISNIRVKKEYYYLYRDIYNL